MIGKACMDAPGGLQHIICREIERRTIFWIDDDRDDFVERTEAILKETSTACYTWALLTHHFHLLLKSVVQDLLTGFVGNVWS